MNISADVERRYHSIDIIRRVIDRSRMAAFGATHQKTATGTQLKALLSDFNIGVSFRNGDLGDVMESVLEDEQMPQVKSLPG